MLEFLGGLLAAGVAVALAVSIVGLAMLGLLIWGGISLVNRLTGKSSKRQNLPAGSSGRDLPGQATQVEATYEVPGREYDYLDVDDGATAEAVRDAMAPFLGAPYVGEFARAVDSALEKSDFRRKGLYASLRRQFEPNTLTWDKFSAPIGVAMDGILRNSAHLANRVQGFDISEYERLKRLAKAGACTEGSSNWQRWELYEGMLAEMRELRQANDQLLFELEKLQNELDKLDGHQPGSATDDLAEEIRKLSEEAKYYSQG